jgi:hypothetical protein
MMPLAVMAVPRSGATHHQDWGKASDVERIGRALHDSMAKKTYPRGPSQATRLRGGMPRLNGRAVAARLYAVRIGDKATTGWDLHNSRNLC